MKPKNGPSKKKPKRKRLLKLQPMQFTRHLKKSLPIRHDDTGGSLHDRLAELGVERMVFGPQGHRPLMRFEEQLTETTEGAR